MAVLCCEHLFITSILDKVKVKSQGAPHDRSSPVSWFCCIKQLRVLLLTLGWEASASQGYHQQYVAGTHFKRDNVRQSFLS